jgi:TM2 domain-containing membrane protein YozV
MRTFIHALLYAMAGAVIAGGLALAFTFTIYLLDWKWIGWGIVRAFGFIGAVSGFLGGLKDADTLSDSCKSGGKSC